MADRPIPFSPPMVSALLDGRKSQTRRLCRAAENFGLTYVVALDHAPGWFGDEEGEVCFSAGYKPGDRLYVREEYYQFGHWEAPAGALTKGGQQKWRFVGTERMVSFDPPSDFLVSRSKAFPGVPRWYRRLGRFMPRVLSRLTLTVTDVRVERLQDIIEADAIAEGVERDTDGWCDYLMPSTQCCATAYDSYRTLWDNINGPDAWDANPWIVAVSFDVRKGNIDAE